MSGSILGVEIVLRCERHSKGQGLLMVTNFCPFDVVMSQNKGPQNPAGFPPKISHFKGLVGSLLLKHTHVLGVCLTFECLMFFVGQTEIVQDSLTHRIVDKSLCYHIL